MTEEQKVGHYARMQKIRPDIREEMRTFDHATQAFILRHTTDQEYEAMKAPLTAEHMLQLQEQAGGKEELGKAIEREKARREELAQLREMLGEIGEKQE